MKEQNIRIRQWMLTALAGVMICSVIGCQRNNTPANNTANGNSAANNSAVGGNASNSTPTSANTTAPGSESSKIEQKAKSIAGKWEPVGDNKDHIIFEFTEPNKEGDTFAGTFNFGSPGNMHPPQKYIVSGDEAITIVFDGVKSKIKCDVSADGKSMRFTNQDGDVDNLVKAGSQANKPTASAQKEKSDCTVKSDDANYFVEATEKTIKLKKGTLINVVSWQMHQGLYVVKAKIDGKWVRGEINAELIDCPDEK